MPLVLGINIRIDFERPKYKKLKLPFKAKLNYFL